MRFKHCRLVYPLGVLLSLALWFPCRADTVFLKNGTELDGEVLEDTDAAVVLKQRNGVTRSLRKADVETIVRERKVPSLPALKTAPSGPEAGEAKPQTDAKPDDKAKEEWAPPAGLPGFPKNAKRMAKDKEEAFLAALEQLANPDEGKRQASKAQIADMGAEVLPYLAAGTYHVNVDARSACLYLIGQLSGRSAVKQVIEVFYAAMPETGEAATYQVPFIRAIKETLPAITGESINFGEPRMTLVQDSLKAYVDWYNANYDRLPPQLGDPVIEPTDPEYGKKLKEARKLNLVKREWPRPPMPTDIIGGPVKNNDRPDVTSDSLERPADKAFKDTIPKVKTEDTFKRGNLQQQQP